MIEETLDPRPPPDRFVSTLASRALAVGEDPRCASWLRGWHDREGVWTNLRNIEHWIERAGR